MNLVLEEAVPCQMMDWRTVPDGEGGFDTVLSPGAIFQATITQRNSETAQIAQAITQISEYEVFTSRSVTLKENDIFKRLSDEKIFQIYIDPEAKTPQLSSMDFRMFRARLWKGSINGGNA